MKLLILIPILLITACKHNPAKPDFPIDPKPITPIAQRSLVIDNRLLEPCKPLKPLESNEHSGLLLNIADNVIIYRDCSDKHSATSKILKELSDSKKEEVK